MKWTRSAIALTAGAILATLATGCDRKAAPPDSSSAALSAMNRGVSLMGQYLYDDAVKAFEEVLQAAPDAAEAKINLAIARFNRAQKEQRDVEVAGELLDAVLQQQPTNAPALYFKAIVLQHLGQTEGAVPLLEKVLEQHPDDGVAWYILGVCRQRLGQSAERELTRAIELRPYLGSAYYRLWQSLQAEGRSEQAAPYLEKFKQLRENPLIETIELPQYNQMGDLALTRPFPVRNLPPITRSTLSVSPAKPAFVSENPPGSGPPPASPDMKSPAGFGGAAAGDLDSDGAIDLVLTSAGHDGEGRLRLLRGGAHNSFTDLTTQAGLSGITEALSCALGDFDNDEVTDLAVACAGGARLFRGHTNGTFVDVTQSSGLATPPTPARCVLFLDADHDGDLDLFVGGPTNQLWNNNADGGFTNIAASAGTVIPGAATVAILPGDVDGDRDADLVLLREGQPAVLLINELLGRYRVADPGVVLRGDRGGVLQDFNGDGHLDLLGLGGEPVALQLALGDGHGHFRRDAGFDQVGAATASQGTLRGLRATDVDLDGDLDIAVFATDGHLLFNDGAGRFVLQTKVWPTIAGTEVTGAELFDVNGDLVPDLLRLESGSKPRLTLSTTQLTPPSTALGLAPTGMRGRDKRTRSPASGFGVTLTRRAGFREQKLAFTGLTGGACQSVLPAVLGLGGASKADYVQLLWPDGVSQVEIALAAGQTHKVAELQRKISSCPVLFTWNGQRFEFVTDFAGVGGLGYFVAPGEAGQPQPLEHVKIEAPQLQPRDGHYELRITEPMEETAYVDRLELRAVDHPTDWLVYPDERAVAGGPPPTRDLLVVPQPIFPVAARAPDGQDCLDRLLRIDRAYAYDPPLDRRFIGFCREHRLELDFGDRLMALQPEDRVFLFVAGFIEYPYSQTVYAAGQARVAWQPIRVERQAEDGAWQTLVPDGGWPGGMGRVFTLNLSGQRWGNHARVRLTTNLEIGYDQVFIARDAGANQVTVRSLPLAEADLRRVGFAREFSPDGRLPLIYDYDGMEATAPFHVLRGAYTRYGPVKELLTEFDDRYVLVGPGDEIALKFDARRLPPTAPGMVRSFVLVSHAWCKDMDLYTAAPQTLGPLPFRAMSRYPYPAGESYPDTPNHCADAVAYHTRIVE
jgi:Tfp pilus assembly protein PilF